MAPYVTEGDNFENQSLPRFGDKTLHVRGLGLRLGFGLRSGINLRLGLGIFFENQNSFKNFR